MKVRTSAVKVDPDEYILSVLSREDRLDAALKVAQEAFRNTTLTLEDINKAVTTIRRKRYEKETGNSR
jgi:hypothetical protein